MQVHDGVSWRDLTYEERIAAAVYLSTLLPDFIFRITVEDKYVYIPMQGEKVSLKDE